MLNIIHVDSKATYHPQKKNHDDMVAICAAHSDQLHGGTGKIWTTRCSLENIVWSAACGDSFVFVLFFLYIGRSIKFNAKMISRMILDLLIKQK